MNAPNLWWEQLTDAEREEWYRKFRANPSSNTTRPRKKPAVYFRGIRIP